ncbi:MAG: N-acetyl-gamma-glutamyl-phosphate reductase [Clostridia bacterium]|nr:N-acetyl-gamma-glutamyl-phosphate reductase [Clostridia bacterium]
MTNIFIDGSAGTTGLRIYDRLSTREDISLIKLPENLRKDDNTRADAINSADIVFLCLPDDAARQAVSFIKNDKTAIIDTSTAHRVCDGWVYGFPELTGKREAIINSKRIANPGCHASGFIALIKPLIEAGVLDVNAALSCFSLTGYSGGGKKMIADYENTDKSNLLKAPRQYGLTQQHKHLKEMQMISGLQTAPTFCPVVADFYSGMEVTVTLFKKDIKASIDNIKEIYKNYYNGRLVRFCDAVDEGGFLSAAALSGKDDMQLTVNGNDERILLVARYDNLGKGASGAAIQNMNILMGVDETIGLVF